jgi:hypothetical protein
MAINLTVEQIIEAAGALSLEERARLVLALTEESREPKHHITELRGLGKEVWAGIDAQEYVNAERDSWER